MANAVFTYPRRLSARLQESPWPTLSNVHGKPTGRRRQHSSSTQKRESFNWMLFLSENRIPLFLVAHLSFIDLIILGFHTPSHIMLCTPCSASLFSLHALAPLSCSKIPCSLSKRVSCSLAHTLSLLSCSCTSLALMLHAPCSILHAPCCHAPYSTLSCSR